MLAPIPKLWKEKVAPWIETCNRYYQNEGHQSESRTENLWYSRP